MGNLLLKIATPLILAGLFVIVCFLAFTYQSLDMQLFVVFALLIVYVILFGFASAHHITMSVHGALKKMHGAKYQGLKGKNKDELTYLADTFVDMADQLQSQVAESEKARKTLIRKMESDGKAYREAIYALEQKVKNRTMEMERVKNKLQKHEVVKRKIKKALA